MSYFSYGQIIRNARKYQGMTQEELADGICAVSSLSKIENGRQVPHYRTFQALLERLGERGEEFSYYMTENDLERRKLLKKIEQNLWNDDFVTLKLNFDRFKKITGREHRLEYQWKCLIEQIILFQEGGEIRAIREQILHIISMTFPKFREKQIPCVRHTHCELFSMLMMGLCEQKMGHYTTASEIYHGLLYYTQNAVCDHWMDDLQIGVYYFLSMLLFEMRDNRSSATFCRKGIEKCLKREKYHMAVRLLSLWPQIVAELEEQ